MFDILFPLIGITLICELIPILALWLNLRKDLELLKIIDYINFVTQIFTKFFMICSWGNRPQIYLYREECDKIKITKTVSLHY